MIFREPPSDLNGQAPTSARVAPAMTASSLVGMTSTSIFDAVVLMTVPCSSFAAGSISTPSHDRCAQIARRTGAAFSPMPAVKMIASRPPLGLAFRGRVAPPGLIVPSGGRGSILAPVERGKRLETWTYAAPLERRFQNIVIGGDVNSCSQAQAGLGWCGLAVPRALPLKSATRCRMSTQ